MRERKKEKGKRKEGRKQGKKEKDGQRNYGQKLMVIELGWVFGIRYNILLIYMFENLYNKNFKLKFLSCDV